MKRGNAVAVGIVGAAVLGYSLVLVAIGPAGAQSARTEPAPAAAVTADLPPQGQMARAVALAEESTGAVAIEAEAKNGDGVYEVELALGEEEIEVLVDTRTERVIETERKLERPFE